MAESTVICMDHGCLYFGTKHLGGHRPLTPSADVPACRDEDPAWAAALAACYPDPPEYQHPEDDQ